MKTEIFCQRIKCDYNEIIYEDNEVIMGTCHKGKIDVSLRGRCLSYASSEAKKLLLGQDESE